MVINSQRTIYGLALQMAKLLDRPYEVRSNTTLNEKFNINTNIPIPSGSHPSVRYYTIGVGGVGIGNGASVYNFSKHKPTDAALFEHIPFVAKPITNDLSAAEQANYRFRITSVINGTEYALYYLKLIDDTATIDDIYIVDVVNEVSKLSKFTSNNSELLNPIPRNPSKSLLSTSGAKYVTPATKLNFSLSSQELSNINDVLMIFYGNTDKAITEIGVCSGVEVSDGSTTIATNVQITYHIEIEILTQLEVANIGSVNRSIEIGGTEPLIL